MRLKLLLSFLVPAAALSAQFTAERALTEMPEVILAPASRQAVADLIEYVRAGQADHAERNAMGGDVQITELSAMRASVSTGYGRTLTLDLIPAKNDTLIALTETLLVPAADSKLTLYSRNWTPQPKAWSEPGAADWLSPAGRKNRADFELEVPFITAEYEYDSRSGVLTLTHTCGNDANAYILPSLHYRWTGKAFKKMKE